MPLVSAPLTFMLATLEPQVEDLQSENRNFESGCEYTTHGLTLGISTAGDLFDLRSQGSPSERQAPHGSYVMVRQVGTGGSRSHLKKCGMRDRRIPTLLNLCTWEIAVSLGYRDSEYPKRH